MSRLSWSLSPPSIGTWVERLIQESSDSANKMARAELTKLCRLITTASREEKPTPSTSYWQQQSNPLFSDDLLGKVVEGSLKLWDLGLLYDALSAVAIRLPLETYSTIGSAVQRFGFAGVQNM
jgi:hypothetical protein